MKRKKMRGRGRGFLSAKSFSFSLFLHLSLSPQLTREVRRHPRRRDVHRRSAVIGAVGRVQRVGRRGPAPQSAAGAGGRSRGGRERGVHDVGDGRGCGLMV